MFSLVCLDASVPAVTLRPFDHLRGWPKDRQPIPTGQVNRGTNRHLRIRQIATTHLPSASSPITPSRVGRNIVQRSPARNFNCRLVTTRTAPNSSCDRYEVHPFSDRSRRRSGFYRDHGMQTTPDRSENGWTSYLSHDEFGAVRGW